MKSDLSLFTEDSMLEAEDVDLNCLTHFIILDDVVDNSLRFICKNIEMLDLLSA